MKTDTDKFFNDMFTTPPLLMDEPDEPDELSPMCPLSMAAGKLARCERRCVVCPPLMLWLIARQGVTVGGTVGTYTNY